MSDAMQHETEYLAEQGGFCPFCRSRKLRRGPVESVGETVSRFVYCRECGNGWTDAYQIATTAPSPLSWPKTP